MKREWAAPPMSMMSDPESHEAQSGSPPGLPGLVFRYLDSDADRRELVADVQAVRAAVIGRILALPAAAHHVPRYHGWSPAAMLTHLHLIDSLARIQITFGLIGIAPPIPMRLIDPMNDAFSRWMRARVVSSTVRSLGTGEKAIVRLILTLPMSRFSRRVFYPALGEYLTIERALQAYFVYHWRSHLETIAAVDGPPLDTARSASPGA
jgi:hypothetical protein